MRRVGACGCWWPPAGDVTQIQMSQSLKHCTVIASHSGVLAEKQDGALSFVFELLKQ